MRWPVRLGFAAGLGASLLLVVADTAVADVVYTENARQEFAIDEEGSALDGGSGQMAEGWRAFAGTDEGRRIEEALAARDGVRITVDVLPGSEVGSGESAGRVHGTAQVTERNDDGEPTAIVIKIRNDETDTIADIADTIYHEFRHAEIALDGDLDAVHDRLDAGSDALLTRLGFQLDDVLNPPASAEPPPLSDDTPISDAIADAVKARADEGFFDFAIDLGVYLDLSDVSPINNAGGTIYQEEPSFAVLGPAPARDDQIRALRLFADDQGWGFAFDVDPSGDDQLHALQIDGVDQTLEQLGPCIDIQFGDSPTPGPLPDDISSDSFSEEPITLPLNGTDPFALIVRMDPGIHEAFITLYHVDSAAGTHSDWYYYQNIKVADAVADVRDDSALAPLFEGMVGGEPCTLIAVFSDDDDP